MKDIRTRIAPSPTGYVHVGTLRTALFNYFLAKQKGGKFFIRLEDTDRTRLVDGASENLLSVFNKLDIEFDEGLFLDDDGKIVQRGEYGPYIQSERLEIYQEAVNYLIDNGYAYHCFCSKERLEEMREEQKALKMTPKYDRKCLNLTKEEVEKKIEVGESYVIRLKIPEGETEFEDMIRGKVKFSNEQIDDQVILKADGFPTYHLAVVVDDAAMQVSHVIRGEEWLSSTPKHIILYQALNYNLPSFAHLPLLLNPDKSKLSKRQGDVSVEDFLNKGYLPEVLINFIGTLGFNPKSDQEIYTIEEMIELFDLSKVNKAGAVLNMDKLNWMNSQYLMNMNLDDLSERVERFHNREMTEVERKMVYVERSRMNSLVDFKKVWLSPYSEVEVAEDLVWKKADASDSLAQLNDVLGILDEVDFANIEVIESYIKGWIKDNDKQNGNVLWPLRVALSGSAQSPSPFELLWVFGRDESGKRIKSAIEKLQSLV